MKKINESKNGKKANATINKVLEEMSYAENYIKRWNAYWQERCSNAYSIDLYYLDTKKIKEIEELYHNQYILSNAKDFYTRPDQPLKKVILHDNNNEDYSCEFGEIEWYGISSNKTRRNIVFKNNGDISYTQETKDTKTKSTKINYITKYNVNTNDLYISFESENEKIHVEFHNSLIFINNDNLSIEINMTTGIKRISYKVNSRYNQSVAFEIIIDKNKNIISKSIEIKNYDQDNEVTSIYNLSYHENELIKAVINLTQEQKEYDIINDPKTISMIDTILLNCSLNDPNLCINEDELEGLIESIKDKIFNNIKSIKGDIPLKGLSKRLDIALAMIKNKIESDEQKQANDKRKTKKINHNKKR